MNDKLYIITPYFNPWRYKSRGRLYQEFREHVQKFNCELITIEVALRDRDFETNIVDLPSCNHSGYIGSNYYLRTKAELWHKERLINLAITKLPIDWQYVAWIDADVQFARDDWVMETIHMLQHYSVIQMFSESINLSPTNEMVGNKRISFIKAYFDGWDLKVGPYHKLPHPGFAWAMRRDACDHLGGLIDTAILGSGDLHMARALTGNVKLGLYEELSPGYVETLELWQSRADEHIRKNVGYMSGLCIHYWHGSRKDRQYNERWKILTDNNFDPEFDLKPDSQGLWQFSGNKPQLEEDIRRYFASRNEDSIDVS